MTDFLITVGALYVLAVIALFTAVAIQAARFWIADRRLKATRKDTRDLFQAWEESYEWDQWPHEAAS